MEELRELIALLRENGLAELELENEGFRVRLRRESSGYEATNAVLPSPPAQLRLPSPALLQRPCTSRHAGDDSGCSGSGLTHHPVTNRRHVLSFALADADAFVKIGSNVEPESVVCIIEAMKLMNEIQAEASGEVVKIYVENGQPVEYGQPLFGIRS
jgi:acetyl-CoA carboxylase biotin carboxyl carrier protein